MPANGGDVEASLKSLNLSDGAGQKNSRNTKRASAAAVAESWEDELDASSEDEDGVKTPVGRGSDLPKAPPPTPISPTYASSSPASASGVRKQLQSEDFATPWSADGSYDYDEGQERRTPSAGGVSRPEKTDAVAKRMIAGALGVRAPKKTEEQREYEKAMREKEAKRRNKEREAQKRAQEATQKAKSAVWDD